MFKKLILLLIIFVPIFIEAQTKPKRDISKDRSVILAKQKELAKKQNIIKKRVVRKRSKIKTPKKSIFLKVDGSTFLTENFSSYSNSKLFKVETNADKWSIEYLPWWCKVTKFSDSFILSQESNSTYDHRTGWFKVVADDKEVKIDITQEGKPLYISSNIRKAWMVHNCYANGKENIKICVSTDISGGKDVNCYVVACIYYDKDNKPVKASYNYPNHSFATDKSVYAISKIISPKSDDNENFYVEFYLPNQALDLYKKRNKLRCELFVYCKKTSDYIAGANYSIKFKAKKKKYGLITTK